MSPLESAIAEKATDEELRLRNEPALLGLCVIVTGATRGLGEVIARSLRNAGAEVVPLARSTGTDINSDSDVKRAIDIALSRTGRIDVLINNAAIHGPIGPFGEMDFQAWADAVTLNLIGSARVMHHVIPHMKSQRRGKIIQLSGGGATSPRPNFSSYAAAKTGLIRLVETVALELKDWHIDVNAVAPGALATRLLDEAIAAGETIKSTVTFDVPCDLIKFLVSRESDGVTGKLISAQWDDWRNIKADTSDRFTLRRVP